MAELGAALVSAEYERHEREIASQFAQILPAHPELDDETRKHLTPFVQWSKRALVRHCPSKPSSVAAFILIQAGAGVPRPQIVKQLDAIERLHDVFGLSNPVATTSARYALSNVSQIEPPRSWPKADKLKFELLPVEIRAVIAQREQDRDKELRRIQNAAAEKRHPDSADQKPVNSIEGQNGKEQIFQG